MSNKNIDVFARPPSKSTKPSIRPFELNNEGRGQALVLRYAGCNLRCPLCYAWKYAWIVENGHPYEIQESINKLQNLPQIATEKIVWVRIQGGEPCLTFTRILNTITFAMESLNIIHKHGLNYFKTTRAVIQTNGITFSGLNKEQIEEVRLHLKNALKRISNGRIVFEVSFKSPRDQNYLKGQIKGYNVLLKSIVMPLWHEGFDNVTVYPIAGLGPSIDGDNLFIIPIDPHSLPNEVPLFHPNTWDQQFKDLVYDFVNNIVPNYEAYRDFRRNKLTKGGKKIAIEELEPTGFQSSWISGYANKYKKYNVSVCPVDRILRKLTNDIPKNSQWKRWYNSWVSGKLFGRSAWKSVLNQIPVSKDPEDLISKVQEMKEYFYPSHPIGHYPYL